MPFDFAAAGIDPDAATTLIDRQLNNYKRAQAAAELILAGKPSPDMLPALKAVDALEDDLRVLHDKLPPCPTT